MQSQQKVPGMTLSRQLVKRSLYLYVLPATNHLFVGACNESGELNDLNTQTPDSVKKSRTELRRGYLVVEENLGWMPIQRSKEKPWGQVQYIHIIRSIKGKRTLGRTS